MEALSLYTGCQLPPVPPWPPVLPAPPWSPGSPIPAWRTPILPTPPFLVTCTCHLSLSQLQGNHLPSLGQTLAWGCAFQEGGVLSRIGQVLCSPSLTGMVPVWWPNFLITHTYCLSRSSSAPLFKAHTSSLLFVWSHSFEVDCYLELQQLSPVFVSSDSLQCVFPSSCDLYCLKPLPGYWPARRGVSPPSKISCICEQGKSD